MQLLCESLTSFTKIKLVGLLHSWTKISQLKICSRRMPSIKEINLQKIEALKTKARKTINLFCVREFSISRYNK